MTRAVIPFVLDEDAERIEVVVPDEQLSLAIGRRGQNVRLASQLTGLDIDIMTEAEESERRQKEFEGGVRFALAIRGEQLYLRLSSQRSPIRYPIEGRLLVLFHRVRGSGNSFRSRSVGCRGRSRSCWVHWRETS